MDKGNPTVNLILFGRNDDYHNDYICRTNASLNYNLYSISKAGLAGKIRITLFDWASEVPLASVLTFSSEYVASGSIEIVTLSEDVIVNNGKDVNRIDVGWLLNLGISRSTAEYVFIGASDVIAPPHDWMHMYMALTVASVVDISCKYLVIERSFLHRDFFRRKRWFHDIDFYLVEHHFQSEKIVNGGGAGLIGASRTSLVMWGGINESIREGWCGYDTELFIRATKFYNFLNLSKFAGVNMYKFPYAQHGRRTFNVRNSSQNWIEKIDNGTPFCHCESLSSGFEDVLCTRTDEPSFPVFKSIEKRQNLLGIKTAFTTLSDQCYYEYVHSSLLLSKCVAELSPEFVIFSGAFSALEVLSIAYSFPTRMLFWLYPEDGVKDMLLTMNNLRKSRSYFSDDIFTAPLHCIRLPGRLAFDKQSCNFLKCKVGILFAREDNGIFFRRLTFSQEIQQHQENLCNIDLSLFEPLV